MDFWLPSAGEFDAVLDLATALRRGIELLELRFDEEETQVLPERIGDSVDSLKMMSCNVSMR